MPVRKAERLVNLIVYLLDTSRPRRAEEIRRTIPGYQHQSEQAFHRMFERDKEELRDAGIPIEVQPTDMLEEEYGYTIPKERYYLPDIELEEDELAALWMAAGLLRLPDPTTARTALLKLTGAMPPEDEKSSLSWLAADIGMTVKGLPRVFQAVVERKTIRFRYRPLSGQERMRTVDPYGLVNRKGAWYVIGRDASDGEIKSFRFDRMTDEARHANPSSAQPEFAIPTGFRPEDVLHAPPFVQGEDTVTARVRFDVETAWRVERESPWLHLDWADDGSAEASFEVAASNGFVSWLLSFGSGAEVIEPGSLRRSVLEHLEKICA
jgi:predicted DNA-binding transcriptional regulator YafY